MKQLLYERSRDFSTRKVSVELAVRILNRNGIRVNKENAQIILDFLYRIAKTFKTQNRDESCRLEPREDIEPLSKHILQKLSTCLFRHCLSGNNRRRTNRLFP